MIKIQKISKSFNDNKVLDNFSYHFKKGEKYYINGASGAGKTTLLRVIMNLEQQNSGKIEINGILSVVFQENRLVENISPLENIAFVTDEKNDIILQKLELFGLKGFENVPVSTLSGGMKRRVSILRAILFKHDILLLDEPFQGLDEAIKDIIISEINTLKSTIIIATHDKNDIKKLGITHQINL